MGAFNSRFRPNEVAGLPLPAVVGFAVCLVAGVLSIILSLSDFLPLIVGLVPGAIAIAALVFALWCLRMGDELPFIPVILAARRDRGRHTSETWTRE